MSRLRAFLALCVAASLVGRLDTAARADDRPRMKPSRDVDITYAMLQPNAPDGPRVLTQRMRWDVADGKLRVDPPSPGMWMVIDEHSHTMSTVQESAHTVMVMDAPDGTWTAGAENAVFRRHGESRVAGLACTDWETKDVSGTPTLACLTEDGVLLRAIAAGRILVVASSVTYGPADASVFRMPDGYQTIKPPPLDGKKPR